MTVELTVIYVSWPPIWVVSPSSLEKDRVQRTRIPFIQISKKKGIRYRKADLRAFIEQSSFNSTSEYLQEVNHGE